jgi:hypothetical protein
LGTNCPAAADGVRAAVAWVQHKLIMGWGARIRGPLRYAVRPPSKCGQARGKEAFAFGDGRRAASSRPAARTPRRSDVFLLVAADAAQALRASKRWG